RAGYWSVEALAGAEALLLGLQVGSFAWNPPVFNWEMPLDGSNGGRVGTVLGGLWAAGFGPGLAAIFALLLCITGGLMLLPYTPLIYPAGFVVRLFPLAVAGWIRLTTPRPARPSRRFVPGTPLVESPNFVTPEPAPGSVALDTPI